MPRLTIPSLFGWRSKKAEPTVHDLAAALAFVEGFRYALGPGGQALREAVFQEAVEEALRQLEPTIIKRADAAGIATPRTIVELQAKQREFTAKLEATKDPKYQYYLEALNWMIPTNGH